MKKKITTLSEIFDNKNMKKKITKEDKYKQVLILNEKLQKEFKELTEKSQNVVAMQTRINILEVSNKYLRYKKEQLEKTIPYNFVNFCPKCGLPLLEHHKLLRNDNPQYVETRELQDGNDE